MGETYASAGVSIERGDEAVGRLGPLVASTNRPGVIGGIGGFAGMFALDTGAYRQPVLVSSADGVGTKLEVARAAGVLDTIGIDLVAMCVDDLVCVGAEPLFLLDYLAVGAVDPDHIEAVVAGVSKGCVMAGCALLGGEIAEHAKVLEPTQFDLAGFAVGVVDRDEVLDGSAVRAGDVLLGLASPGLRSNGYTLARRLLFETAGRALTDPCWDAADAPTVAEELLRPSVVYAAAVLPHIRSGAVHALAHITGGGMDGNLPRALGAAFDGVIDPAAWPVPLIFGELQRIGDVDTDEMRRVFNLGIGMVAAVAAERADETLQALDEAGIPTYRIGEVVSGSGSVRYR